MSENNQEIRPEFEYLNMVRDNGGMNMFGVTPYLAEEFGLDRREAKQVLLEWMQWVQNATTTQET
jgi:hypothetical protein